VTVRKLLSRLGAALVLWAGTILLCVLYSHVHPSSSAYVALALLALWYVYIPILFVIVSAVSFMAERRKRHRGD
jgi:hypothetical protein